jgi:transcriptional regulator with XRE-family HTH domain
MISTGLTYLDKLTGGLKLGDNVAWEAADGVPVEYFVRSFFSNGKDFGDNIVYISFNFSPHTILQRYDYLFNKKNAVLIDAFTHGKGNSDSVFSDFYRSDLYDRERIICIENPKDIKSFMNILNEIETKHKEGSFYIFDGLTGMNELWKDEKAVLDFFAFTCPKLYDLKALAYWMISREAHSREFIAGIMHVTQIVFSISATDSEYYELKVHKLQDRTPLYGARPVYFRILDKNIIFDDRKAAEVFNIGDKVKNLRKEARMTQAELAASLNMTPGAVSQIENDIITPSLQTLLHLSSLFGRPVDYFIGTSGQSRSRKGYIAMKKNGFEPVPHPDVGLLKMTDSEHAGIRSFYVTLKAGQAAKDPIMLHKGREFMVVVKGSLKITINGDEVALAEGDSILITDSFPSRCEGSGDSGCEFVYMLF